MKPGPPVSEGGLMMDLGLLAAISLALASCVGLARFQIRRHNTPTQPPLGWLDRTAQRERKSSL